MYFLDADHTVHRMAELGFEQSSAISAIRGEVVDNHFASCDVQKQFANSYVAAKHALEFFGEYTQCLMYVHSLGNRPSMENRHLYERLRLSYGERRSNRVAPGMLFEQHHAFDLQTFCDVVINYRFSAVLVQHATRNWIAFADGEMHFFSGAVAS